MTAALWVRDLASYSAQIAIIVALAALLARLFQLRSPTPALAYWQTLLVAFLLLPLGQPWRVSVAATTRDAPAQESEASRPQANATTARAPDSSPSFWLSHESALWIVAAGILARTSWLALGFWTLGRFRRDASPLSSAWQPLADAQRRVGVRADFYVSDDTASPITFGLRRPAVLLPGSVLEMEPDAQRAILYHELLHVRRHDWACSVMEECVRALLWFHPAIWWLVGRIQLTREQVVDQAVVELTESRERYVEALLAVARAKAHRRLLPASLFLRRGRLKERVAQILTEASMTKRRLVSCLLASAGVLLLAAAAAARMFPLEVRASAPPIQVVKGGEAVLHRAPVEYPRRALERRVAGDVLLDVSLDEQGLVYDARVVSGPEELRAAALQSVLRWHFGPPTPLPGATQVVIRFELPKEDASLEGPKEHMPQPPSDVERVHHRLKELQKALAEPSATDEQRMMWKLQLAQLKSSLEQIRGGRANGKPGRGERVMEELKHALADQNATDEQRAHWKRQLEELQAKIHALKRAHGEGSPGEQGLNGTLTAIRTERISEAAWRILRPRLEINEGDVITEEVAERIRATVAGVDEHFHAIFRPDGQGGITLVIVGP